MINRSKFLALPHNLWAVAISGMLLRDLGPPSSQAVGRRGNAIADCKRQAWQKEEGGDFGLELTAGPLESVDC